MAGRSATEIGATLMDFAVKVGHIDTSEDFDVSSELFESGYIDSLGIVALTSFIEEEFGVVLSEQDMFSKQFKTVAGIAKIVADKLSTFDEPNRVARDAYS